jgi:formylmethanofuran dehydrogenase subunit E
MEKHLRIIKDLVSPIEYCLRMSSRKVPKDQKKIELRISKAAEAYFMFIEAGLTPLEEYVSTNQKWKSKCQTCGQIVSPRVADVKGGGGGCRPCAGVKAQKKRFPDQEAKALEVAKKANLQPLEPYKNAQTKWKCKCLKCGEIVTPTYHNLEQGNGGCINCQEYSFQPNQPSYLYVMTHTQMSSLKIGVGNQDNKVDRIKTHKRYGWELLKRYDFKLGANAVSVENLLLKWFRTDLKLPPHLTKELMIQFGHSETVDLNEIDLPLLFRKVEEFKKGLEE